MGRVERLGQYATTLRQREFERDLTQGVDRYETWDGPGRNCVVVHVTARDRDGDVVGVGDFRVAVPDRGSSREDRAAHGALRG